MAVELPDGVSMDKLLHLYDLHKRNTDRRKAYLETEAGKEYNRLKAKEYYTRHKSEVLLKRKAEHEEKKETHNARALAYYHANREVILEKKREKRVEA
jgi:hypothetical protein